LQDGSTSSNLQRPPTGYRDVNDEGNYDEVASATQVEFLPEEKLIGQVEEPIRK
jgi:hypothetical protein